MQSSDIQKNERTMEDNTSRTSSDSQLKDSLGDIKMDIASNEINTNATIPKPLKTEDQSNATSESSKVPQNIEQIANITPLIEEDPDLSDALKSNSKEKYLNSINSQESSLNGVYFYINSSNGGLSQDRDLLRTRKRWST